MFYPFIKKRLPKASKVFDTYWSFAAERQNIFFNRYFNGEYPWTNDIILLKYKFTNAYRASDRVSQYLIKNVIYSEDQSPEEVFFRIILFKIFNKIETWEYIKKKVGNITYSNFNILKYDNILLNAVKTGKTLYSGAYIMPSGKSYFGNDFKYRNHLFLIELLMQTGVGKNIPNLKSLEEVYNLLKSFPSFGSFLSFQYAIDINYSNLTSFSEMDFVVPGPGAIAGLNKCFPDRGDFSDQDIIRYVCENQEIEFLKRSILFKNLWGRPLNLIDCQNLFCEIDKYSRVAFPEYNGKTNRKRIKQLYNPNSEKIVYWYPPKWGLNSKIQTNFKLHEEFSGQFC